MNSSSSGKRKRLLCAAIALMMTLSLSGCWSSHEIDDLVIINSMAIDEDSSGAVEITAAVNKPTSLFADTNARGTGDDQQRSNYLIISAEGKSVIQAISQLSRTLAGRMYMGHMDMVVFGEQAARDKMNTSLDVLKRNADFRPNIRLFVTKGMAKEMIKAKPQLNKTLGLELHDLTVSNRYGATGMVNDFSQFMKAFSKNTADAYTGEISLAEANGVESEMEGNELLSLKGTAVFKGEHLAGFLDEQQTRGLLWLNGKMAHEVIVMNCGGKEGGNISLKVMDTQAELFPKISGSSPSMKVNMQVRADIEEISCEDVKLNSAQIDQWNKQLQNQVQQEVSDVLSIAKNQWQADIFSFGQAIYRKYPGKWKGLSPQWRNGLLQKMPVQVKVTANISQHGLLKNPGEANEAR